MAGKCYNKPRHVGNASFSVKTNQQNLIGTWTFARHVYASFSASILCRYLKLFIQTGNQRVSQSNFYLFLKSSCES